jgi:NADP-dependent 3-hydroxy acid dehydrogenase YdfG
MKTIFITGATSGIGKATAETFAKQGHRLIICGRRKEVLEQLQIELSNITEVYSLVFDVRNQEEVENAIHSLPEEWKNIDVLVNNAGNAHGLESISEGNIDDMTCISRFHDFNNRLRNVEQSFYISVHHRIPICNISFGNRF